jgi:dTMP kinase
MTTGAGVWVSVDGVEGAGKTTLVHALRERIPAACEVSEFCSSPIGDFLKETVRVHPHIYSDSLVGQSLIFLGEYWERYDTLIDPQRRSGGVVLSDRGYWCKYAYQYVILERAIGGPAAETLLSSVFAPMPRPTLTVVLSASIEVIRERLIARGDAWSPTREEFVRAAAVLLEGLAPDESVLHIKSDQLPPEAIAQQVVHRLSEID